MKCKIFTSQGGYILQGVGKTPIKVEDAIVQFINGHHPDRFRFLQSQSGEHPAIVTHTIIANID